MGTALRGPGGVHREGVGRAGGRRGRRRRLRPRSDTIAFERLAPGEGHALLPAHRHLLVEAGVYIIEALDLDALGGSGVRVFVFILSPLKLVGGTGSPVRPLAVVGVEGSQ
jgi:hypothetical protein